MNRTLFLLALLAGLWCLPHPAMALACNARIDNFNFGSNVTPDGSDTSSVLTWQCRRDGTPADQTLNIRMCLFIGEGTSQPGVNPRWMRRNDPPNILLSYDIFADSARSQVLGSATSGHPPFSFTLQLPANTWYLEGTVPIYGRIYPRQNMLPYQYVDANLAITPVRSSYNVSAPAPDVGQCMSGGGDGVGTPDITNKFNVQAQVADTCFIGTATDLEFGQVSTLDSDRYQTSTITLRCPWVPWQVGLNNGSNNVGNIRRMVGPGNAHITYELYRDSGRTQRWGNTLNSDTVAGNGNGALQSLTVYGRVPVQPTPAGGTYSDTVTVTLTF